MDVPVVATCTFVGTILVFEKVTPVEPKVIGSGVVKYHLVSLLVLPLSTLTRVLLTTSSLLSKEVDLLTAML